MNFVPKKYIVPFVLISSLFFIWGFARAILDVLNKHFQDVLSISITESALVQGTTYLGYFLTALPAGIFITRCGYRNSVVTGLLMFAIGAFIFIPGEHFMSFGLFLFALFLIGCGLAMLETAANPYASELGDPDTASSRLNLAQSLNGLGSILGPVVMGGFLFTSHSKSVALPYSLMGIIVLVVVVIFSRISLPEIGNNNKVKQDETSLSSSIKKLWSQPIFRAGVITLFFYEIAEISINSLFINYVISTGWLDKTEATTLLSFGALGMFMIARIAGSWIMTKISAPKVLLFCGCGATLAALTVTLSLGNLSTFGLLACYAFEAIIFPTVFAITISRIRGNIKLASSFLMMTPIGGAVGTILMGVIADNVNLSTAFIVPAIAFCCVIIYAFSAISHKMD